MDFPERFKVSFFLKWIMSAVHSLRLLIVIVPASPAQVAVRAWVFDYVRSQIWLNQWILTFGAFIIVPDLNPSVW